MLAALVLVLLAVPPGQAGVQPDEVRALWRCEPTEIGLGEPFELVLELTHPADVSGHELAAGALELDESWVVLGEEPVSSAPAGGGALVTRRAWRVASLEPGERVLSDALSQVALSERVTRIQVGEARVTVSGILAAGEDAPRPLREFPDGFGGADEPAGGPGWTSWLGLAAALVALGAGALAWRRRRARRAAARPPTVLERLRELEGGLEGARGNEGCYELTRLLRAAGDELGRKQRGGLTDEEWLAEITASLEIPRNAVSELTAVFERTARVKYGGEAPTPWSMQETFQRARAALEVLCAGAPSAGGTRS
jgi:hypothetical protein